MLIFPIVIKILELHGLETEAQEGKDYFVYQVCYSINDIPKECAIKILGSILIKP